MGESSEKKNGNEDYFKSLFGQDKKGGLSLFVNNPFHRKEGQDYNEEKPTPKSSKKSKNTESRVSDIEINSDSETHKKKSKKKNKEELHNDDEVKRKKKYKKESKGSAAEEEGEKSIKKSKRKDELSEKELSETRSEKKRKVDKEKKAKASELEFLFKEIDLGKSLKRDSVRDDGVSNAKKKRVLSPSGNGGDAKNDGDMKNGKKRKRESIEADYETIHGMQSESREIVVAKSSVGKRRWDDEVAEMVSQKDKFDDQDKLHRTVFVGNLPLNSKKKKIIKAFAQFGDVESVRLRSIPIIDSKLPRKSAILNGKINESAHSVHAYVVFQKEESAKDALSYNMAEFGGNHIRVDRAQPPCKKQKGENHFTYDFKRTVFVGNLPFDVKDEELYQLFMNIKPLESSIEAIRVIRDSQTSIGKGIAYVLFKTMDAAKLAVKKNQLKLRDRELRLSRAKPDSQKKTQQTHTPKLQPQFHKESKSNVKRNHSINDDLKDSNRKRAKLSLSYQGTKANKTDSSVTKVFGTESREISSQKSVPKERKFKRPSVAARKTKTSKSPLANVTGEKRKREQPRSGNSRTPKRSRGA